MAFMIEGEWSGYSSSQQRICHRTYHGKKFAELVKAIGYAIRFTDGTLLILNVKEVPRRKNDEIHGYDELISKCAYRGVNSVAALYEKKEATG